MTNQVVRQPERNRPRREPPLARLAGVFPAQQEQRVCGRGWLGAPAPAEFAATADCLKAASYCRRTRGAVAASVVGGVVAVSFMVLSPATLPKAVRQTDTGSVSSPRPSPPSFVRRRGGKANEFGPFLSCVDTYGVRRGWARNQPTRRRRAALPGNVNCMIKAWRPLGKKTSRWGAEYAHRNFISVRPHRDKVVYL